MEARREEGEVEEDEDIEAVTGIDSGGGGGRSRAALLPPPLLLLLAPPTAADEDDICCLLPALVPEFVFDDDVLRSGEDLALCMALVLDLGLSLGLPPPFFGGEILPSRLLRGELFFRCEPDASGGDTRLTRVSLSLSLSLPLWRTLPPTLAFAVAMDSADTTVGALSAITAPRRLVPVDDDMDGPRRIRSVDADRFNVRTSRLYELDEKNAIFLVLYAPVWTSFYLPCLRSTTWSVAPPKQMIQFRQPCQVSACIREQWS